MSPAAPGPRMSAGAGGGGGAEGCATTTAASPPGAACPGRGAGVARAAVGLIQLRGCVAGGHGGRPRSVGGARTSSATVGCKTTHHHGSFWQRKKEKRSPSGGAASAQGTQVRQEHPLALSRAAILTHRLPIAVVVLIRVGGCRRVVVRSVRSGEWMRTASGCPGGWHFFGDQ